MQAPLPAAAPPKEVVIYTDGGADPNPGRGGYGAVLLYGPHRKELCQGYRLTTNNRMELMAAIAALSALKEPGLRVRLHTDSQYVAKAFNERWVEGWQRRGWKKVKNVDLWQRLVALAARHSVQWVWVRGHAGNVENERCDALCAIARAGTLLEDEGYEPGQD